MFSAVWKLEYISDLNFNDPKIDTIIVSVNKFFKKNSLSIAVKLRHLL